MNVQKEIKGFTVLEVVVAIFIFGLISTMLVKSLTTADRISGRANFIRGTVIIAENEAERIRNAAAFNDAVLDCTYITNVDKREFDVERKLITENFETIEENEHLQEIELVIKNRGTHDSTAFRFRFLQGYSW